MVAGAKIRNQVEAKLNRANRPLSNQIDRFGRIAFDKNKELSQASLDVDKDGSVSASFNDRRLMQNGLAIRKIN